MIAMVDVLARSLWSTIAAVAAISAAGIVAGKALGLTTTGAIGLYFVTWWILLFAVLPVGMRTQADVGEIEAGTDPGAPAAPALRERAIWTSIVSAVAYVGIVAALPLTGL